MGFSVLGCEIQGAPDAGTLAWACGALLSPESQFAAPGGDLHFPLPVLVLTWIAGAGTTVSEHGVGHSVISHGSLLLLLLVKVSIIGPSCSQGNAINIHYLLINFLFKLFLRFSVLMETIVFLISPQIVFASTVLFFSLHFPIGSPSIIVKAWRELSFFFSFVKCPRLIRICKWDSGTHLLEFWTP